MERLIVLFRPPKLFALLLLSLLLLTTACSRGSSDSNTNTPAVSTAPPVATTGNNSTPPPSTGIATPDDGLGTPPVPQTNRLNPPDLIVHTKAGAQLGNFGAWYWQNSYGLIADTQARAFEIQPEPIALSAGETITFDWRFQNSESDTTLKSLDLTVYPHDGNLKDVPVGEKTLTGFWPQTDPTTKTTLPLTDPAWTVDLPSGEYFIVVHATWSNPIGDHHERYADYSFRVQLP